MATAELVIPEPSFELLDEKYLEYLDGQWIKKESVGRKKHENVTQAVYNLLNRYRPLIDGKLAQHWTIILGSDKAEPDGTLSHPVYNVHEGYLVSPAFLVVEVRSYGQTVPYLVNKCRSRYHRAGISYCWIIDADTQTGYECHREGPHPHQVEILTAGPVIVVPVVQIFEEAAKL